MRLVADFDPRKLAAALATLLALSNGVQCAFWESQDEQLQVRCEAGLLSLAERLRDTLLKKES